MDNAKHPHGINAHTQGEGGEKGKGKREARENSLPVQFSKYK